MKSTLKIKLETHYGSSKVSIPQSLIQHAEKVQQSYTNNYSEKLKVMFEVIESLYEQTQTMPTSMHPHILIMIERYLQKCIDLSLFSKNEICHFFCAEMLDFVKNQPSKGFDKIMNVYFDIFKVLKSRNLKADKETLMHLKERLILARKGLEKEQAKI